MGNLTPIRKVPFFDGCTSPIKRSAFGLGRLGTTTRRNHRSPARKFLPVSTALCPTFTVFGLTTALGRAARGDFAQAGMKEAEATTIASIHIDRGNRTKGNSGTRRARGFGAGTRNRTATCCLEGSYSTVKPCPHTDVGSVAASVYRMAVTSSQTHSSMSCGWLSLTPALVIWINCAFSRNAPRSPAPR